MSSDFFNEHMRYRDSNGNVDYSKEYIGVPYSFPIKTLKLTSEVSLRCLKTDAPISVIKNGYEVMVIMDADFFDKYLNPYIIDGKIDVAKVLEYMPLFINIKALKNTGELSKHCAQTKNAIHIIKNGVGELVIMNLEVYNTCKERALVALKNK